MTKQQIIAAYEAKRLAYAKAANIFWKRLRDIAFNEQDHRLAAYLESKVTFCTQRIVFLNRGIA